MTAADVLRDIAAMPGCPDDNASADPRAETAPLTEEEIAVIEARRRAVQEPIPWEATADGSLVMCGEDDIFHVLPINRGPDKPLDFSTQEARADFAANAPKDIDGLLATVWALRQKNIRDCMGYAKVLLAFSKEDASIRAIVSPREGEATIDAVKRAVAILEVWRELADVRELDCACSTIGTCWRCQREDDVERKLRELTRL